MNDAGQVIRQYLTIARRQWWVIAQAMVVVGLVAAFMASRVAEKPFSATTTLIVEDTSVTNNPQQAALRLAQAAQQVSSAGVAQDAAAIVGVESAATIASMLRVTTDARNGTILVTATWASADRPPLVANAVADAYVARESNAVTASLRQRLAESEAQAKNLGERLAQLDEAAAARAFANLAPDPSAKAERDVLSVQLTQAYASIEATRAQIATALPDVEVLFPATGSAREPRPSPITRGLQGAVAGLFIGIALAALREVLDTQLRDRAAIEAELPWPTLGEIVIAPSGRSLAACDNPTGPVAEAMRKLRTNLRFLEGGEPIRSIVVTSPEPGDGKTFLAANLAVSFAQLGVRTVIVSGDLRRPTIDRFFVPQAGTGLSDAVVAAIRKADGTAGHTSAEWGPPAPVESLLRWTGIPNLWLLPAGTPPHNPAELLSSEHAAKLIDQLTQAAEMVVIDAPPLIVVDPVLLGGMADGLLVVASVGKSQRSAVRHARDVLGTSRERVLGLVINRAKSSAGSYGYYGYSSEAAASPSMGTSGTAKVSRRGVRKQRKQATRELRATSNTGESTRDRDR